MTRAAAAVILVAIQLGGKHMTEDLPGVMLTLGQGTSLIKVLGQLVHDQDGNPFAEQIVSTEGVSVPLPHRIRLYQDRLELRQQARAGRPAMYFHRGIMAIP